MARHADEDSNIPGARGFRYAGASMFGVLGLIGARRNPLQGFDPEAFQHGAYADEQTEDQPDERK